MTRMKVVFYGSMMFMVIGMLLAAASGPALSGAADPVMAPGTECPAMKQCPALRGPGSQPTRDGSDTPSTSLEDPRLVV